MSVSSFNQTLPCSVEGSVAVEGSVTSKNGVKQYHNITISLYIVSLKQRLDLKMI